jgi:hypothetical protein
MKQQRCQQEKERQLTGLLGKWHNRVTGPVAQQDRATDS